MPISERLNVLGFLTLGWKWYDPYCKFLSTSLSLLQHQLPSHLALVKIIQNSCLLSWKPTFTVESSIERLDGLFWDRRYLNIGNWRFRSLHRLTWLPGFIRRLFLWGRCSRLGLLPVQEHLVYRRSTRLNYLELWGGVIVVIRYLARQNILRFLMLESEMVLDERQY